MTILNQTYDPTAVTNLTNLNHTLNTTVTSLEGLTVWPAWMEITIPLLCVLVFLLTLTVMFLRPSKPGDNPLCCASFLQARSSHPKVSFIMVAQEVTLPPRNSGPAVHDNTAAT